MAPKRKQTVKKATPKVTRAPPAKMKASAKKIAKAIKKTPAKRAPAAAPDLTAPVIANGTPAVLPSKLKKNKATKQKKAGSSVKTDKKAMKRVQRTTKAKAEAIVEPAPPKPPVPTGAASTPANVKTLAAGAASGVFNAASAFLSGLKRRLSTAAN